MWRFLQSRLGPVLRQFGRPTHGAVSAPPAFSSTISSRGHKDTAYESLTVQMIAQGRVALLLRRQVAATLSTDDLQQAQQALDNAMAIVPQGAVAMRARCHKSGDDDGASRAERLISVDGFFLD